jgi:hypothetical protein
MKTGRNGLEITTLDMGFKPRISRGEFPTQNRGMGVLEVDAPWFPEISMTPG